MPDKLLPLPIEVRRAKLAVAAVAGNGIVVPHDFFRDSSGDLDETLANAIRKADKFLAGRDSGSFCLTKPTGAGANLTVLLRIPGYDERLADAADVRLLNPEATLVSVAGSETLAALGDFDALEPVESLCRSAARFLPGEARLYHARRMPAIRAPAGMDAAAPATAESRIVVSGISPAIDDGRFPAKRIVGEQVAVEADIFSDSHTVIL